MRESLHVCNEITREDITGPVVPFPSIIETTEESDGTCVENMKYADKMQMLHLVDEDVSSLSASKE